MALYLVTSDTGSAAKTRKLGANAMIVSAADTTDALAIVQAKFGGDSSWADATFTAIADVTQATANGLVGWVFTVKVATTVPISVSVTGDATTDTIDEIGAALVVLLNATTIDNASYAANVLTIAAIADGIGDKAVTVTATPPVATYPEAIPVPGMIGTIVDEGIAGAALTVAFKADTYVVPTVIASVDYRS